MLRFLEKISRPGLIFALIGISFLWFSAGDAVVSLKTAKTFDTVVAGDVSAGDRVAGKVPLLLDSFAVEQTWTENSSTNSVTPKKNSSYYFVLPSADKFLGLMVNAADAPQAKSLVDQTYGYFSGGAAPTAELIMEGRVMPMEEELVGMFKKELQEYYGISEQDMAASGTPLIIVPRSFFAVRTIFGIGFALFLLGLFLLVRRFRKFSRMERANRASNMY